MFLEALNGMPILEKFKRAFFINCDTKVNADSEKMKRIQELTLREYEAFLILLKGDTLKICAEKMGVKHSTVNTYQNAIYKKLEVKNRANLIIEYKDIVDSSQIPNTREVIRKYK